MDHETLYRLHANCPHLTILDLSYNTLDISNIKILTEYLKKNTHVTSLNLEGNNITNKGAFLIRDMLTINTHLKKLNLIKTHIPDEGRRAIGKIVNKKKYLEILFIKNLSYGFLLYYNVYNI